MPALFLGYDGDMLNVCHRLVRIKPSPASVRWLDYGLRGRGYAEGRRSVMGRAKS